MAKADSKREKLFQKFSDNLHLLVKNELVRKIELKYEKTYICPICLNQFCEDDLREKSKNRLSLEDAPPKSLKGSQIALTCKSCNNICGHQIDFHLTERMRELDFRERIEGATQQGKFKALDKAVLGGIRVLENKVTQAYHHEKANNPKELKEYLEIVSNNVGKDIVKFEPKPTKVNAKYLQIALLKSAYIMMFAKFGYSLILNHEYDRVREQLLNPEKDIYPIGCWFKGPFPKERYGIPFITEKKLESIFTLFGLHTDKVERTFAVVLPLTSKPIEIIIKELGKRFNVEKNFEVEMYAFDSEVDYLKDLEAIKHMLKWIEKFKNYSIAHNLSKLSTKELMDLITEIKKKIE